MKNMKSEKAPFMSFMFPLSDRRAKPYCPPQE
jgi:hypothetical protein